MGGPNEQIWLTYALSDTSVLDALSLSFSLRNVKTSRKLGVLISSKLSGLLREALDYGFDYVFYLDEDRNTAGLKGEEFVKLFALTLKSFERCVMLSPKMLVVKNSDELFDYGKDEEENERSFQPFSWAENGDMAVLLLSPSLPLFKKLMKGSLNIGDVGLHGYLKKWLSNQNSRCNFIDNKFNQKLCAMSSMVLQSEDDVFIVDMNNCEKLILEKVGHIEKKIFELWKHIRNEKVDPLLEALRDDPESPRLAEDSCPESCKGGDAIAIVGMSCRYPSSNNLEEFWQILLEGKDGTGNPPEIRWLREQCSRNKADSRKTNAGFLKCPVDDFDAKFFNISPKEMVYLDPQHRLLHELVWEGLEDAAINPQSLEGTNGGVFIGSWMHDYKDILSHSGNDEFYRMYMGNSIGAGAARISHLLGLTGPSIATESGCSSAMVAVHLACKSLQRRETNMALACGVNLLLHPFDKDEMPMVISPAGRCKTFDAKADGFARGEGGGVLVLKRLSDAVRDGDKIWALIKGTGMIQEGISKSIGTPTVHCESLAMKEALSDARVTPEKVTYVEAHGTGTTVGDPMEVAAIAKAYHSKQRKEPLLIGSVKTNVGHTESCSGITGIMKVVLALHHEIIPPHRNFETLNPSIDLEAVPAKIPLEPVKWPKQSGIPRVAGVSSFGITGTDAHAILQEPPPLPPNILSGPEFERPIHIMKISAKTDEALDILLNHHKVELSKSDRDFKDMAFTANTGRADFTKRLVIIGKSKGDAIKSIEEGKVMRGELGEEDVGKICFLFTGQGSQYPGMAKQLYETSPVFRMHFEHCEKILKNEYNLDITKVLWSSDKSSEISRTIYSQTSIFCVEYALLKLWESWGIKADYVLGHSLGEFAAAVCAGILNVEDALKLVAERSRLIDELPHGKMLVIKAEKQRVDSLMNKFAGNEKNKILDYAAVNAVEQTVVAGDSDVVMQFAVFCKEANLKCIMLEATHAFHSKHMDPMLNAYRKVAETVEKLEGNNCKYISGMRGNCVNAEDFNAEYWVEHTRNKVNFLDASKTAVDFGCRTFIEIGPQPILSALTMANNDLQVLCVPSLRRNEDEWETLLNTLGKLYLKGVKINWNGVDQFYERKKVSLPHYPFIGKKFWPDLLSVRGSTIHPLVGSVLPNASSTKIFQNGLNLGSLEYVKDHVIGENVIFPGAGFLEMCLAAGLATVESSTETLALPSRAMKVENLEIQAPLRLDETGTCQLQTIVELNISKETEGDWNDMKVNIFRRMETESTKWLPHAKATFSPVPTAEEKTIPFDTDAFTQTLKKPSNDKFIKEIYDKLGSVGLKFGPSFRSLETIWRDEEQGTLIAKVKVPTEESPSYIIHPVVLDAMIQSIMMLRLTSNLKKKLYVPIKIGKFIWLSPPTTDSTGLYIHAFSSDLSTSSPNSSSALLLDSNAKVLGAMSSVEFIDTTVKAIESVLEQQTSCMPDLWEEKWLSQVGSLEHRVDLFKTRANYLDLKITPDDCNKPPPHLADLFSEIEKLVYLNMLRCLYVLGWEPTLGQILYQENLCTELGIRPNFRQYFGFILEVFRMEGILVKEGSSSGGGDWRVISLPPSKEETESVLTSPRFTSDLCSRYSTTPLFLKVGEKLSKILTGKEPPLNILFPEEKEGYPSVTQFYTTYEHLFQIGESGVSKLKKKFDHMRAQMGDQRVILRVLEIGAGTGSYTENFVLIKEKCGLEFEYTYTDISAAFFPAAANKFEKHLKAFKFKKLNIEEDPIEQGFPPEYYDIVIASDVIHATKNIETTLKNVRMLLKPGGRLDIQEMTKVHRFLTYLFGLLEGFWRFEDFELRSNHCTLSIHEWAKVLGSCGFEVDGILPMLNEHHSLIWAVKREEKVEKFLPKSSKSWLIFHQPKDGWDKAQVSSYLCERFGSTTRKVISIYSGETFEVVNTRNSFIIREKEEEDFQALFKALKSHQVDVEGIVYCWALNKGEASQEDILRPYFYLTKSLLSAGLPSSPRLIGITNGVLPLGDIDLCNFPSTTIWGFTKSLKNENNDMALKLLDVELGPLRERQLEEIFYELWTFDKELILAYREGKRYYPKFQPHKPTNTPLKLPPATDRFQLILPNSRSISDLQFGTLEPPLLKEDEVEVQIKASALNFRDVLSVIKPSEEFKDINTVGFDFAGVIRRVGKNVKKWNVGDRVCGCNIHFTALPSHVTLNEEVLLKVPNNIALSEAATMPAVYITSVLCLMDVAKIQKDDVVLIHTATGGVGLSAIEICKHVGSTIIATAGSKRKQNYLKSLGIQHIFHSRNTKYTSQILELTNGRGVDVVLNSLTSEGFKEATLKVCAKNARFVEMSKLNIWTEEEVKELRPDVKYTTIDVSTSDMGEWKRLLNKLSFLQERNVIKPIPYLRFDALNVREALQYMQKAKHIGKIVCTMPELRQEEGKLEVFTPMFNDTSTYLITGGLGGIGFVICQWMVEKGAKHVILAGRRPPNATIQSKINEMNFKGGKNVKVVQLDVGDFSQCEELIQTQIGSMGLPPLKGVMHVAGTISDGLIINQDWPTLSSTFNTKVNGTLNLHELTKSLDLEHFVVFSSMAALFGNPGQCNHAAGNSFEDALIHYRNSMGLPGTTVNWGQWGEVGVATEVDLPGLKTISNLQGLSGLEYVLKSQRTQLSIVNVESFLMLSKLLPHLSVYLDERVWKATNATTSVTIKSDEFWQQYDSKLDSNEKMNLLKEQLKNILKTVLKLDEGDNINEDGNFQEMGVDSLMFVEIKNHLQALFGSRVAINASALKDCNTVNLLAETLVKLIEGDGDDVTENEIPPTMEEINGLIREDCILPDHIAPKPGQTIGSVREIKKILLTGCTGTIGPYFLKELSNMSQITHIICLIRQNMKETWDERLRKVLDSKELLSQVDMKKVTCVNGNVAQTHLGLELNEWENLAESVDAVVNCSARVHHTEHYRKRKSGDDVRGVNIGGMKNLLEFSCEKKLKHFCHLSSLLSVLKTDGNARISEAWPNVEDYDGVTTFAYPISKFVSEFLAKEAVERGIPCKVIRLPLICGESVTGRCSPETSHALLRYMFIMKNGIMSNTPWPTYVLPVDTSAQLTLRLFFHEGAGSDVYNIGKARADMDQEFVNVAHKFGYKVELVELSEFIERVQTADEEKDNSALEYFKELYKDEDAIMSSFSKVSVIPEWVNGNEDIFLSKKVTQFIPNVYEDELPSMQYIYNDLLYAKSQGWFKKFGL